MTTLREAARAVVSTPMYEQPHVPRSEGGTGFVSVEFVGALRRLLEALDADPEREQARDRVIEEARALVADAPYPGMDWPVPQELFDAVEALDELERVEREAVR